MVLYQDLPVFADVYRLTLQIFTLTKDFPREYKFILGQDMKRDEVDTEGHRKTRPAYGGPLGPPTTKPGCTDWVGDTDCL